MNKKISAELFDVAVTMKHGQSHWEWYEQEKLNE